MKPIKLILCVILLGMATASCKEDEFSGTLSVTFRNHDPDMNVNVYSIDNLDIPLGHFQPDNKGKAKKELNVGNYYITVSSSGTHFSSIGCQIKVNSTTSIFWDTDNSARIIE